MEEARVRILLIEDDKVDRMALLRFMGRHAPHYDPVCVSGVSEAREALKTNDFDVVITDYNLGDGVAFDLFQEMPRHAPIIVITGAGHEEIAVQAMKAGASDYLIKDAEGNYLKILEVTVANALKSKAAERALRESEEQLRLTFESARDAIVWVDPETGRIIRCNRSAEALLERPREEIVGADQSILHPAEETRGETVSAKRGVTRAGTPYVKAEVVTSSGKRVPVEISSSFATVNGKTIYQAILRDVTERDRMERLLRQAHKMEALGALAGGIAHDFNNILYVIIGFAELALEDVREDTLLHGNIRQILDAANRAKDVVTQILAFSRGGDQERRLVNIGSVFQETMKFLRASMPATIEIRSSMAQELGMVVFDPTHLHQILMNLAANASHAMREQGGLLEVDLADVRVGEAEASSIPGLIEGSYLRLTVRDTGHGMPPQVLERVFEPYFTTKKPGEGTGLGLAVVHGIVTSEGGAVTVESEPGKGAVFNLYLPVVDETESRDEGEADFAPLGTERILLVDDDAAVAAAGRRILESLGYMVETRTSSVEALELFKVRRNDFDLVVTDMTMPNLTGAELTRELKAIRPDIPVVLCTGFSEMFGAERPAPRGVTALVMKPVRKSHIARTIRRALDELPEDDRV